MKWITILIVSLFTALNSPLSRAAMPQELSEWASTAVVDLELEGTRGTGGLSPDVLNETQLKGIASGNTITNPVTGYNVISDNALQNTSGLVNVIQNSGNGVVIQNSMTVNFTMKN